MSLTLNVGSWWELVANVTNLCYLCCLFGTCWKLPLNSKIDPVYPNIGKATLVLRHPATSKVQFIFLKVYLHARKMVRLLQFFWRYHG